MPNMYNILYYHQYEVYSKNIFNIHRSQSTFYCSYVNKSKINENINLNWWNITQWVFNNQIISQICIIYCIIINMKYIQIIYSIYIVHNRYFTVHMSINLKLMKIPIFNWWNITQSVFNNQTTNQISIIYCIIINMKYIQRIYSIYIVHNRYFTVHMSINLKLMKYINLNWWKSLNGYSIIKL